MELILVRGAKGKNEFLQLYQQKKEEFGKYESAAEWGRGLGTKGH